MPLYMEFACRVRKIETVVDLERFTSIKIYHRGNLKNPKRVTYLLGRIQGVYKVLREMMENLMRNHCC